MTFSEPKFYAEILERIRSISLAVEFSQAVELRQLKIEIEGDETSIVRIQSAMGQEVKIPLNRKVPLMTVEQIQACAKTRERTLSMRLPLSGELQHDRSSNFIMSLGAKYKWNALELRRRGIFKLNCSNCSTVIVDSQDLSSITEMPSELWAEMMDFWHCHKPHEGHHHVDTERFSTLRPSQDSIITGSYYFALRSSDLAFKVESRNERIYCQGCDALIGEHDKGCGLDKLFKWCLLLDNEECYEARNYVYNSLLDNVNGSATRMAEYVSEKDEKVLLWVFNVGFDYITTSGLQTNAIKLYYTRDPQAIEDARQERGELETVDVPQTVFDSTIEYLEAQNNKIPLALSMLNYHWKLGMLGP